MARPRKATVDYFPHVVKHGKTITVLEMRFGNDGYAFWFKLLEELGSSEGHFYDCNNPRNWEFLLAKTRLSGDIVTDILDCLAEMDAIDSGLWRTKVVFCQNFVDNLEVVYARRKQPKPVKPSVETLQKHLFGGVSVDINQPETDKEKDSKEKKRKKENIKRKKGLTEKELALTEEEKRERFEKIWLRYPVKDGKVKASSYFNKSVFTEKDWQDINKSLDNYLAHLKLPQNQYKHYKAGKTWFYNWQDWLDWKEPDTPEQREQRAQRFKEIEAEILRLRDKETELSGCPIDHPQYAEYKKREEAYKAERIRLEKELEEKQ